MAVAEPKANFVPGPQDAAVALEVGDPLPSVVPGPVRCLLLGDGAGAGTLLQGISAQTRHELVFTPCRDLDEARALVGAGHGDLIILTGSGEADALTCMRTIGQDGQLSGTPVVLLGADMVLEDVVAAMRAGVAECLAMDDLTANSLDQAVEAALARSMGTASDQRARLSNISAENDALRRISARNMRLLKSETVPLLALAWRFVSGEKLAPDEMTRHAKGLARITRNVTGLVDDTVIVAATYRAIQTDEPIALNELVDQVLREDMGEISASRAHIVVHGLPTLRGRRPHFEMLFEELLLTAVRQGRVGRVPEVEVSSGHDPDGNPIIIFTERGLHLSARKQGIAQRGKDLTGTSDRSGTDPHAWSLCQRLVEKNQGTLRITETDGGGTRLMMRFPSEMQVAAAPDPATVTA